MKKILKLGAGVAALMLSTNVVKAAECDNLVMYANSDFWTTTGVNMKYNGNTHWYSLYKLKDNAGTAYSAYCRNAGWTAANSYAGQAFYCDHTVFDSTSESETEKIYGAGVVGILKNGYSTRNSNYNTLADEIAYSATNVALRVYEMLWPDENTNGTNTRPSNRAHEYYVNLWLDDTEIQQLLQETVGKVRSKFDNVIAVDAWEYNNTDITEQVADEALKLVKIGLEAAKYYKENGAASLKGVDSKPLKTKEPVVTDRNGNKEYKTSLTYTFEADKFKSTGAYIYIDFSCADCSRYNVDYTLYINDNNVGKNISNLNLLRYLSNGSGTLEFKIEFSSTSEKYNCETLNFDINLKWFDETIDVEAYSMYSSGCSSNAYCQHFYMLYATDVPTEKTISSSIELCTETCKDLENACNNGDAAACKRFQDKYNGDCAECTTYINNAACSENDSNIDITEGYDVDTANCGNITENNNLNVLQCVIGNTDAAGNTYRATNGVNGTYVSNSFCSVYCKEDYHFVLPGIKETQSGRYFSLKASVTGAKTCYTSKIDEDNTFSEQLEEKRQAVIDAWNEWNKWYQGSLTPTESEEKTVTACCGGGTYSYTNYFRKWTYLQYSTNGNSYSDNEELRSNGSGNCSCHKETETYTRKDGTTVTRRVCGYGSCNPKDGDYRSIENKIKSNLSSAESSLKAAIKAYADLITQYNSCSGTNTVAYNNLKLTSTTTNGWKMDYKFSPSITFWYEESYMNSVITDELQTVGNTTVGGFTQQICTSDTNNSYKNCSTGWKTSIDKNSTTSQFVCKQNGSVYTCGTEQMIISKAKYVKQEMTSSGSYITPTQFYTIYPTGAIVSASAGAEDSIENSSELTNLLPVGLGTTQGVYNFALKVKNLGEYYNKSKLGRLWGDSNSVVVNVLEEASDGNSCIKEGALTDSVKINGTTLKDGVYVCAYKVNCPDCDVECDPVCEIPDCPDGECPVECDNCIYTNGSTNVSYKPITPGDINPSDRDLGINWKYDANSIKTALELKAYATSTEIEKAGETIYDINYEDTSQNNDFVLTVKMDSTLINKIREYNDNYEDTDGYANNTLKCYDYTQNGKTYDNIYCYSTFLDELLYNSKTKDNFIFNGNRIIGTNTDSSDSLRKSQTQSSGYWTTWAQSNSSSWTVTTEKGLSYYKENYSEIGIGPSWK